MNQPLVSVILPVYNVQKYIRPCLDSILAQTLRDIEVICVDDGSTDGTSAVLKEYADRDNRVILLTQQNGGAGKARNTGMAAAHGQTYSFLDSDDFFELNMLEKAYNKLKETKADFVVYDSDIYYQEKKEYVYQRNIDWNAVPPYEPFCYRALTSNVFRVFIGWAWDKLYDAEFVKRTGLQFQEQRTTNDMFFVFGSLVEAKKIALLKDRFAHHRKDEKASLSNTREKSWHCYHDALIKLKEFLMERGLYEELKQDYVNYTLHSTLWNLSTLEAQTQKKLYDQLKNGWLEEFGLVGQPETYFDSPKDYQKLLKILAFDYEQYVHG